MKLFTIKNIYFLLVLILFSSCSTNITDWTKIELNWKDLPQQVQMQMIESIEGEKYDMPDPSFINLDSNLVDASYDFIKTGGGSGYNKFTIKGKTYELHSSARGNKENPPFILHDQQLYYLQTLNVNNIHDLYSSKFGKFNFTGKY